MVGVLKVVKLLEKIKGWFSARPKKVSDPRPCMFHESFGHKDWCSYCKVADEKYRKEQE